MRMVLDLNLPIEIIGCPTVREEDGLAMSTRNTYLNEDERKAATCLHKALEYAKEKITSRETVCDDVKAAKYGMQEIIADEPLATIDYIEILDGDTFTEITKETTSVICALAVKFGSTRLIDNVSITL